MDDFPKLESLSRVQQEVVDKLSALLQDGLPSPLSTLELKSRWNTTVSISRLPPEILLEIFEVLAAIASLPPRELTDATKNPYTWIRSTHVCRYWRDLALRTPSLWRRIAPACDECMETMVGRAGTHTALLICLEHEQWFLNDSKSHPEVSPYIYSLLCDVWTIHHRIHSLEMPAWQEFPRGVVHIPEVKALVLNGGYIQEPPLSRYADDPLFHPAGLPMLRKLVVRCGTPSTTWSLFRPTLEILEVDSLVRPPSVSEWLKTLSGMLRLRKLYLVDSVDASDHIDTSELNDAPVSLLHLDDLRIEDYGDGKAALLLMDHIRTEKVHKLAIQTLLSHERGSMNQGRAMDLMGALNSRRDSEHYITLSVKTMSTYTHAYIYIEILTIPLKPETEPPASTGSQDQRLTLLVNERDCSSVVLSLLNALPAKLVAHLSMDVHFDANLLRPFFRSNEFPSLRILELMGDTTPLVLGLISPYSPSPSSDATPMEPTNERGMPIANTSEPELVIPFPQLLILFLIDASWTGSYAISGTAVQLDELARILQLRTQYTKKPLAQVIIYGSRNLTAEDVERLRRTKVAEVVEWRGPNDKAFQDFSKRWQQNRMLQQFRHQKMLLKLTQRMI